MRTNVDQRSLSSLSETLKTKPSPSPPPLSLPNTRQVGSIERSVQDMRTTQAIGVSERSLMGAVLE